MGNASARAQSIYQLDSVSQYRTYLLEYSNQSGNLLFVNLVGDGKFIKSVYGKCDGHPVIIKIYRLYDPNENLKQAEIAVKNLTFTIESHPNILAYSDWQLSLKSNIAFLIRPYFLASLHDRFNTRPFLTVIEKKWIAFQLIKALEQTHSTGNCHGDIKLENIMITSWNWIVLTDFAPFKPTYLPEDDPSDYYYYFCATDRSNERIGCNIAPERFYTTNSTSSSAIFLNNLADSQVSAETIDKHAFNRDGILKDSMDIFSLGCVIGEIFLNGKSVFDLPSLLRYRTGETEAIQVEKIQDEQVRELVYHMIQRDPRQRRTAKEYREKCTGKVFPTYFQEFLFPLMEKLITSRKTPDERIQLICEYYSDIVREMADTEDQEAVAFFQHRLHDASNPEEITLSYDVEKLTKKKKNIPHDVPTVLGRIQDAIVDTLENDLTSEETQQNTRPTLIKQKSSFLYEHPVYQLSKNNGIILILCLLCSTVRHVVEIHSKITAIHLITRLASFTDDDARLQQLVPYILQLFKDPNATVRATAVRSVTTLLSMISSFPIMDANIFPQYIFPALVKFPSDPDEIVRIAFAECLPRIAETSRRFLDISQAAKQKNADINMVGFDNELRRLHQMISRFVVQIAAPDQKASSSQVKRALLHDITRLCIFFGRERTLDIVLPQLIAVLNDRDPQVRIAFFENITGVCTFVGRVSLELYILPCIEQALVDVEEMVIAKALKSLVILCELGLFQRHALLEKAKSTSPLLFHPSSFIRENAIALMVAVSNQIGPVDVHAFLLPILRPYLKYQIFGKTMTSTVLCNHLRSPVSREAFDIALIASSETVEDSFIQIGQDSNSVSKDNNTRPPLSNEHEKLQMIQKYVQVASLHLQSKLQVAGSEHTAQLMSGQGKINKALIHTIRVPDMRFALLHTLPDNDKLAIVSVDSLTRAYGLQGVNTTKNDISADPALLNPIKLHTRVKSLDIPPLPPDLGPLRSDEGVLFSLYSLPNAIHGGRGQSGAAGAGVPGTVVNSNGLPMDAVYRGWKPRENVLVAELSEHSGAVTRIAVAQDFNFFASGSVDGTVKLWSTRGLAHAVCPTSMYTYKSQTGCINDIVMIDNSHAIASASSNGTVHVFKVEGKKPDTAGISVATVYEKNVGDADVLVVKHMNNITESLLMYATRCGYIYGWDLRFRRLAWTLRVTPELGYISCMVHSTDSTWVAAGTSRGYICLWDIRFQLLVCVWRHPSHTIVYRMILCPGVNPSSFSTTVNAPLVYIAAGLNESSVYDLSNGACRSVFRVLRHHSSEEEARDIQNLEHVPTTPEYRQTQSSTVLGVNAYTDAIHDLHVMSTSSTPRVRALLCPAYHIRGLENTLITAGEDRHIRFWDISKPKNSFTISGLNPGEPKSFYDSQPGCDKWWETSNDPKRSRTFQSLPIPLVYMCQDTSATAGYSTSASERRGPVPATSAHNDSILDLNMLDLRIPVIVSAGRDGLIKIWR